MPLVSMKQMLRDARQDGYGVGYFESWNLESIQAVIDAAEETQSPVIVGFNGGFLLGKERLIPERLEYYAALGKAAASQATVPVALLLNETTNYEDTLRGIRLGFNAVMIENHDLSLAEYAGLVRRLVQFAHSLDVTVEAQIDELPEAESNACRSPLSDNLKTDPELAAQFVQQTGVDALSVSIGNVHILTRGKAEIDFDRLEQIRKQVDVPLVIHGGTGFPDDAIERAIDMGICKFNIGTVLRRAYLESLKEKTVSYQPDFSPCPFLGTGGEKDIMTASRLAVKKEVSRLMKLYGSAQQAERCTAAR